MKTFFSILVLFIFTTSTSFAQKKVIAEFFANAKEIQQRPLKIVLLKEGKESNDNFNENLKAAIDSEWNINTEYSFIDRDEFKKLKKEKPTEFSFLVYYPKKTTSKTRTQPTSANTSIKTRTTTFHEDGLVFFGYNKKGKPIPVINTDICFENSCSKAVYYYSIQDLQNKLSAFANAPESSQKKMKVKDVKAMIKKGEAEQQTNIKKLESMTLFVNEKTINEKLKSDFIKYYKLDYKIVPVEEIEAAIVNNNEKIAILYENKIASADTGQPLLSFMDMKKMKGFRVSHQAIESVTFFKELFSHELQKKDLERLKKVLN